MSCRVLRGQATLPTILDTLNSRSELSETHDTTKLDITYNFGGIERILNVNVTFILIIDACVALKCQWE